MNILRKFFGRSLFMLLLAWGLWFPSVSVKASLDGLEEPDQPSGCLSSVKKSVTKAFKGADKEQGLELVVSEASTSSASPSIRPRRSVFLRRFGLAKPKVPRDRPGSTIPSFATELVEFDIERSRSEEKQKEDATIAFPPWLLADDDMLAQCKLTRSDRDALYKIWSTEVSWKGYLRWAVFDTLFQKTLYKIGLDVEGIHLIDAIKSHRLTPTKWMFGKSVHLASGRTRKRVFFIEGLRQGMEFVVFRGLHTALSLMIGYGVYEQTRPRPPCGGGLHHPNAFAVLEDVFDRSEQNVIRDALHNLTQGVYGPAPAYIALLSPFAWGFVKGSVGWMQANASPEKLEDVLNGARQLPTNAWMDYGRWILPFHPLDWRSNLLEKHFLWSGDVSADTLAQIYTLFESLVQQHRGYTRLQGLQFLAHVVYSLNLSDLQPAIEAFHNPEMPLSSDDYEKLRLRLKFKAMAYQTLLHEALKHEVHPDSRNKKYFSAKALEDGIDQLYSRYLLWTVGLGISWRTAFMASSFKASKMAIQILLIQNFVEALLKNLKCPAEEITAAGVPKDYQQGFTLSCMESLFEWFNIVPGQSPDHLVKGLGEIEIDTCSIKLNLYNKGLPGDKVVEILRGFKDNQFNVYELNISLNAVNDPQELRALFPLIEGVVQLDLFHNGIGVKTSDSVRAFGEGLPLLTALQALDLSHNAIDTAFGEDTEVFAKGLARVTTLTALNLTSNQFGNANSRGTVALGQALGSLINLKDLRLSSNSIGYTDDVGMVALARGIGKLSSLQTLHLGGNQIGSTGEEVVMALGEALPALQALTDLDVSQNFLGQVGSAGTVAFVQGIGHLRQLRKLVLSNSVIDFTDAQGGIALAQQFKNWGSLTSLDVSRNFIGEFQEGVAVVAIGENLPQLTSLVSIDLSRNVIGYASNPTSVIEALAKGLSSLPTLEGCTVLPQPFFSELQQLLLQDIAPRCGQNPSDAQYFIVQDQVTAWCQTLQKTITHIEAQGFLLETGSSEAHKIFMECMVGLPQLQRLDLSGNNLGDVAESSQSSGNRAHITLMAPYFKQLTALTSLNLSNNKIGDDLSEKVNVESIEALAEGLAPVTSLKDLDISYNSIGYSSQNSTFSLARAIESMGNLRSLNLRDNWLGNEGEEGFVALARAIKRNPRLEFINLIANQIGKHGDEGVLALAEAIPHLKHLSVFEVSLNSIGSAGPEGPRALFQSLERLYGEHHQLPYLFLQHCLDLRGIKSLEAQQTEKYLKYLQNVTSNECAPCKERTLTIGCGVPDFKTGDNINQLITSEPDYEICRCLASSTYEPVQASSSLRLSGPFWMEPVKAVWRWGRSLKESTFEKADQMWEGLTNKIAAYASEVVAATPHYHTPGLWVYDEEGEIVGTTEGLGMRTLDDGVNLDRQGRLSGHLASHLESQSVCLIPPVNFGGVASSAPVPLISGGGF